MLAPPFKSVFCWLLQYLLSIKVIKLQTSALLDLTTTVVAGGNGKCILIIQVPVLHVSDNGGNGGPTVSEMQQCSQSKCKLIASSCFRTKKDIDYN